MTHAPFQRALIRRSVLALVMAAFALVPLRAADPTDEQKRITESSEVLEQLISTPDVAIPGYILERAEAIVVIPSLVKGGFIVGGQHGKGIVSVRDRATNTWSAPGFVVMTGGSLGWQIGLQSVDLVLLVMNKEGVADLLSSEFKFGADASVAAGPVGRTAQASTGGKLTAEILAYSRAKGLFAGLSIEGASLRNDKGANQAFYGKVISAEDVVRGKGQVTMPSARTWSQTLAHLIPAGATTDR